MLRRLTHFLGGLVAVFFSVGAYAQYASGFSAYSGLWSAGSGGYTHATAVAACQTMGGNHVGAWWKMPTGPFNMCLNADDSYLGQVWQNNSLPCPSGAEMRVLDASEIVTSFSSVSDVASGHYVCAPIGAPAGASALSSFPAWGDVQSGVANYLKGFSFTGSSQSAGLTAAQSSYDAAKNLPGATPSSALQAASDAAYMAAAKYTSDNETNSIMSRAILAGVAGAGILAALPAFLVGGSLAAAASLAVATVAAGGVAVDAYQSTPSGSAIPTSAANTPVNVRLSSNSPSLAGVAELKLVEQYFVPSVSLSDLGSSAWEAQSGGGYKSTSTAGTTMLSADGKTVTTQLPNGVQTTIQTTTAAVNNAQVPVVVKTVTAPVQTDVGQATASVSTVY